MFKNKHEYRNHLQAARIIGVVVIIALLAAILFLLLRDDGDISELEIEVSLRLTQTAQAVDAQVIDDPTAIPPTAIPHQRYHRLHLNPKRMRQRSAADLSKRRKNGVIGNPV